MEGSYTLEMRRDVLNIPERFVTASWILRILCRIPRKNPAPPEDPKSKIRITWRLPSAGSLSLLHPKNLPPLKHRQLTKYFFSKQSHYSSSLFFLVYKYWVSFRFLYCLSEYYWSLTADDFCTPHFFHSGLKKVEATSFAPYLLQLPKFLVNPLPYHTHTQKIWQSWGGVSLEVKKIKWKEKCKVKITFLEVSVFLAVILILEHTNVNNGYLNCSSTGRERSCSFNYYSKKQFSLFCEDSLLITLEFLIYQLWYFKLKKNNYAFKVLLINSSIYLALYTVILIYILSIVLIFFSPLWHKW